MTISLRMLLTCSVYLAAVVCHRQWLFLQTGALALLEGCGYNRLSPLSLLHSETLERACHRESTPSMCVDSVGSLWQALSRNSGVPSLLVNTVE